MGLKVVFSPLQTHTYFHTLIDSHTHPNTLTNTRTHSQEQSSFLFGVL